MCKGEAPKAVFGLFYPPCYICYGLHAWLRSSNCRESGRVHWRDRLIEAHRSRATLRTTPKTRHFIECRVQSALQSVECRVQCADSRVRHDVQYTLFCLFRHGGGRYPVISLRYSL